MNARSAPPVRGARSSAPVASLPRAAEGDSGRGHLDRCGLHRGSHRGPLRQCERGLFGLRPVAPLGYAKPDSEHAGTSRVITDNLVPYPCAPWSIQGRMSTMCSRWRAIGDSSKIYSARPRSQGARPAAHRSARRAIHRGDGAHDRNGFFLPGGGRRHIASPPTRPSLAERMRKAGVKAPSRTAERRKYSWTSSRRACSVRLSICRAFDLDAVHSFAKNARPH
jgi:citrate lyase subunit alpha/citrate CoA-transferase